MSLVLSMAEVLKLYRRRARRYDVTANLYYLIGFREQAYRERAVNALGVVRGETVVEIGCGTGLNFFLLQAAVGREGRIIGVDPTDAMLEQARRRIEQHGWRNVELVNVDAASYQFPAALGGVISTFALTLVPEYEAVIRNGAAALGAGKRFVVCDLKEPARSPRWLVTLGAWLTRPFGVTLDLANRHPWEAMARHLTNVTMTEFYFGFAYLAVGEASGVARPGAA